MEQARIELLLRARAKVDFKSFVLLKWDRYEKKRFMDNWHYDYLCKILESTLPLRQSEPLASLAKNSDCSGSAPAGNSLASPHKAPFLSQRCHAEDKQSSDTQSPQSNTANLRTLAQGAETSNAQAGQDSQTTPQGEHHAPRHAKRATRRRSILEVKSPLCERSAEIRQEVYRTSEREAIGDFNPKDKPRETSGIITRLMINMPPSYGKTEIIARCFIAWALGNNPQRKFMYVSYSDELCRKISNQVRDLLKSPFFASIFGRTPLFLQDNANEFVLKEGGGLFVTTLKSAITGFHAHQILIDDPIKVSAMASRAERNLVNQNFKESVLSRLQDNQSNITILMQRLGDEDLCGFLLNPLHFSQETIDQWKQVNLKAIEKEAKTYTIGSYTYTREAREPLFPLRHNAQELDFLRLQMGEDEFSTQYLQEPMVSEAGFFELVYFKEIPAYECGAQYLYIFVDNALSLNASADNRAIVLIGAEAHEEAVRYVVRDCVFGIWDEARTISEIIDMAHNNPSAKIFIESDGGGLTLERLLHAELVKVNTARKRARQAQITNAITCYTPSRKISKVEKIKALKPFYNTGFLVFLHNARGLEQIKKELLGFNPSKPFRKDDCIDCIASALAHEEVIAPSFVKESKPQTPLQRLRAKSGNARVAWNF